jgi:hypothetical protein
LIRASGASSLAWLLLVLVGVPGASAADPAVREHIAGMAVYSTAAAVEARAGLGAWTPVDAETLAVDPDLLDSEADDAQGVSSVVPDPGNPDIVYVTYGTAEGPHVWRSADAGASWTAIDGAGSSALPAVPVHAIAIDPTDTARLYVATDAGVFVSRDTGRSWAVEHTGFGQLATVWLAVDDLGGVPTLFAFTREAGVFSVALSAAGAGDVTLAVARSGSGRGEVTSTPGGITCGPTCSAPFAAGTVVELRATPAPGSIFVRWSGGCSGTARTCTVTMTASMAVTATFRSHLVKITRAGAGTGRVTSTPAGIDCGADCSGRFRPGRSVTLTATPSARSVFAGWSGIPGCGRNPVCTFTVDTNVLAVAAFTSRIVTVERNGTGTGTVTSAPGGIDCGTRCRARFLPETTVTLTTAPAAGSRFDGWGGACLSAGTATTCTLSMTQDRTASATFTTSTAALTVSKAGTGAGTITSSPAGLSCGTTCAASFTLGTSVRLTATPVAGTSHFGGWGGACSGASLTCTVTMNAAKSVRATFVRSAQVRFVNHVASVAKLEAVSPAYYVWVSTLASYSAYQPVHHATLDRFLVTFGRDILQAATSIAFTPGRKYRIEFGVDGAGHYLLPVDEGTLAADAAAEEPGRFQRVPLTVPSARDSP